jgi:hypothetical protein
MKSVSTGKAGSIVWDPWGAAKGLYLVKVENKMQKLEEKVFIQ